MANPTEVAPSLQTKIERIVGEGPLDASEIDLNMNRPDEVRRRFGLIW